MPIADWTFFGDALTSGSTFGESSSTVIAGAKSLVCSKGPDGAGPYARGVAHSVPGATKSGFIRTLYTSNRNYGAQSWGLFVCMQGSLDTASYCYNAIINDNGSTGQFLLRKGSITGLAPSGGTNGQIGGFGLPLSFTVGTVYALGIGFEYDADWPGTCVLKLFYDPNPVSDGNAYDYSTMIVGYKWTDSLPPALTVPGVGLGLWVNPVGNLSQNHQMAFDKTQLNFTA